MATNFPTSLDSLTNPATTDQLSSPSHAAQHANANDAIEALEAKVGVDGSTVTTSHAYKIAQLESDIQNSAGDFIPLSVLGQPSGPAELNADGNLIVPENKIIIEGATADAHELTLQAPDVTSDITVTLPNASGTLALTTDVSTAITNLVSSAPATLDTLNELATALGNDANFATTTATSIGNKVSKAGGDIIQSSLSTVIPIIARGASGQSVNLQEWQNSAGTALARVSNTGIFVGGSFSSDGSQAAGLNIASQFGSTSATRIPLVVYGAASQTANLQQWQNSSGTVLASIASNGGIQAGTYNGVVVGLNYPGIVIDTSNADSTQVWLRNLSATSKSGRFVGIKARNGYANAVAGDDLVTLAGEQYINSLGYESAKILMSNDDSTPSTTSYPARITFHTTAINSTTLTERMRISSSGNVLVNGFTASTVGLSVKGAASQTADLQQWQNSAGEVQVSIKPTSSLTNVLKFTEQYSFAINWGNEAILSTSSGELVVSPYGPERAALVVKGKASQTDNLQEWQNSAGTVLSKVNSDGSLHVGGGAWTTISSLYGQVGVRTDGALLGSLSVGTGNAGVIGLVVKGAASQTANLQEWQDSTGAVLASLSVNTTGSSNAILTLQGAYGGIVSNGEWSITRNGGDLNIYAPVNYLMRSVYGGTLQVRGHSSQAVDLQQWQNSAGTVLAKIDLNGAMFTITPAANTNTNQVATTAYVQTELADLVNSAPATLDTLNELATALGNDASFSTTVTNSIALKAPLASPALTGTPTAPTAAAGTNTTQLATTAFVKTEITSSVQPGAVYQTSAPASPAVGQIWIDSDQDVTTFDSNIIRRKSITATAGQTVFTTDLPFIDGFEQVFFNGLLLLKTSDYTTSGGNTVTLTSAAAVSDIVEIVSVTGANSVTTYTQAEVDALLAANTSVAPISISTNTNLAAKKRYFVTSASALTLTLPATPALNDEVQIVDASGNALTYNITVARNGKLINGNAGNLIIDVNGGWYTLVFTGNTYGWKVA